MLCVVSIRSDHLLALAGYSAGFPMIYTNTSDDLSYWLAWVRLYPCANCLLSHVLHYAIASRFLILRPIRLVWCGGPRVNYGQCHTG